MTDSERLREALLEIQLLREKESRVHSQTIALLSCVEVFATAGSPSEAVQALFQSVRNVIGAETLFMAQHESDSRASVFRARDSGVFDTDFSLPVNVFEKARTVRDIFQIKESGLVFSGSVFRSLICCPLEVPGEKKKVSMVGLHSDFGAFDRSDQKLLSRLAGLFGKAIETENLSKEKNLFAEVIANSSTGFAISDAMQPDQPLIYVNQAFETLTGYTSEEVIGQNCRFLSVENRDSMVRKDMRRIVQEGATGRFVVRNRKKNGELFWNDLTLSSVRGPEGEVWNTVATQTDVTRRVDAENARDAARRRMAQVLETTKDAFLLLDSLNEVSFSNAAWRDAFPSGSADWAPGSDFFANWGEFAKTLPSIGDQGDGTPFFDLNTALKTRDGIELQIQNGRTYLVNAVTGEDDVIVLSATNITRLKLAEATLQQRAVAIETAIDGIAVVNSAGRLVDLNTSAAKLLGFDRPSMTLGRKLDNFYEFDNSLQLKSGQYLRKGDSTASPVHEIMVSSVDDGGFVLVIRDISERIAIEERRAEMLAALARAQRQQAVGQMAAGIAHDFNNLLSAINGSSTLISMQKEIAPDVREHANRITAAGVRAARMVNRLLDLGSGGKTVSEFEMKAALSDIPDVIAPSLPEHVEFVFKDPIASMPVRGDPDEAHQMIMNVALNAIDALGDKGGRVEVDFRSTEIAEPTSLAVGALSPANRYVAVSVTDDGVGIAPDVVEELFQPYFSTKGPKGTGLGLATAAAQIAEVGGAIDVKSEPGVGTTLTLYWPSTKVQDNLSSNPDNNFKGSLEGATILVVDDETDVGNVLCVFLEQLGAEVAFCDAPDLAAEAVEEDPEAWTLLITDYDMPGMNGGELIERVGSIAPELPVIVVTALARRLVDKRLERPNVLGTFAKPVDLGELGTTISNLLQCGE